MDEKLIQLVRKREELYTYGMSNKKYSDSVWKEILWGQISEELKNHVSSHVLLRILKLLSLTNNGKFISWQWYNMADNVQEYNRMNRKVSVIVFYTDFKTRFQKSVQLI
jgi:hypothetical protein